MIEYTYGQDELRQAKHHTTLNAIAIMMMNVPIPIPAIRPEDDWQLTIDISDKSINGKLNLFVMIIDSYLSYERLF